MSRESESRSATEREVLAKTLVVHEICATIQGESSYVGLACVLVRLAGCSQACSYCDTPQARPFDAGRPMTIGEILGEVEQVGCRLVEVTGGEPLEQAACPDLVRCLMERGFEVLVETSGSQPIGILPDGAVKIVDIKCPASGECERNDWSNIEQLGPNDQVKFVICDRGDYEWARSIVAEKHLADRCEVLFSPAFGLLEPRVLAEWIVADRLPVRFQIQLHKYVWGRDAKGV